MTEKKNIADQVKGVIEHGIEAAKEFGDRAKPHAAEAADEVYSKLKGFDKEKLSGLLDQAKQLGVDFKDMQKGNKVATAGGAVAALDGVRRVASGLKRDENGKRNLKVAFVGIIETALGAVTTLAAFKAHGKGGSFADLVRTTASNVGKEAQGGKAGDIIGNVSSFVSKVTASKGAGEQQR